MKKIKILSLILSLLMLISIIPNFGITASAATSNPGAQPTILPDGTGLTTEKWVDWKVNGVKGGASVNDAGYLVTVAKNNETWLNTYTATTKWRGASGFMLYIDSSNVSDTNKQHVQFFLGAQSNMEKPRKSGNNSWTMLMCAPKIWSTDRAEAVTLSSSITAYHYGEAEGDWTAFDSSGYYLDCTLGSGWYYIPFTSMYYAGGGGEAWNFENDEAAGTNFNEFMNYAENDKLESLKVKSDLGGLQIGDIYFVYPEENVTSAVSAPVFNSGYTGTTSDNSATYIVSENNVTVGSGANSATSSGSRVWLRGFQNSSIANATGLRFHVDTSALGDGAQLNLRLRMLIGTSPKAMTEAGLKKLYKNADLGYKDETSDKWVQLVTRASNSFAYYTAADGKTGKLSIIDTTNSEGDLFSALPAGFVGDVYIPLDSFWLSRDGSYTSTHLLPFKDVASYCTPLNSIGICGAYTGTPVTDSVTYSNFEWVYADAGITGAQLKLDDNFDFSFSAKAADTVENVSFTYDFDGNTGSWDIANNGEKVTHTYSDILPQQAIDKMKVTLSGTIGGVAVKQVKEFSIVDYCHALLTDSSQPTKLTSLLKATLNYAAQAQIASNYNISKLANEGYEDYAVVSDKTVDYTTQTSKTSDENKYFYGATVRLESSIALRLYMNLDDVTGVTVIVRVGDGAEKECTIKHTGTAYTVLYEGICATQYNDEVTATIKVNGVDVQILTYSVNAYLANISAEASSATAQQKDLANSIYNYGAAAVAYVEDKLGN